MVREDEKRKFVFSTVRAQQQDHHHTRQISIIIRAVYKNPRVPVSLQQSANPSSPTNPQPFSCPSPAFSPTRCSRPQELIPPQHPQGHHLLLRDEMACLCFSNSKRLHIVGKVHDLFRRRHRRRRPPPPGPHSLHSERGVGGRTAGERCGREDCGRRIT